MKKIIYILILIIQTLLLIVSSVYVTNYKHEIGKLKSEISDSDKAIKKNK